jgi:uncharacterized phage protein (predicted DNA packaging)
MSYLIHDDVKTHLRVDFDDDDLYINDLIEMVENAVAIEIGEDLADIEDANGRLPKRLLHAMLLLIGHYYLIREPVVLGVAASKVPLGFEYLIAPFKNFTVK